MEFRDLVRLTSRDTITTNPSPQRSKGILNKTFIPPSFPLWISMYGTFGVCLSDSHNSKVKKIVLGEHDAWNQSAEPQRLKALSLSFTMNCDVFL